MSSGDLRVPTLLLRHRTQETENNMNVISKESVIEQATVPTLANAIHLGTEAIMRVAGNEIANTIRGKALTVSSLHSALATRIRSRASTIQKKG